MKRLVLALLLIIAVPAAAAAAPFLIADPQPAVEVTHYHIILDGVDMGISAALPVPDNQAQLNYDLAGIAEGDHHVEVSAYNELWALESEFVSFDFTKGAPEEPQGIRIHASSGP